ncbi:MAG: hypothetical protein KDK51_08785 [Deltaproteobacteria bacterium]|nr:hypothetical protein [Deltaproteobacteria bacterium]
MIKKTILILLLSTMYISCASNTQEAIEEARFLLDKGSYEEAIDKLADIVADDPSNLEATFLLSSAYVGQAANSQRAQCEADDTGILGLLACFLRTKSSNDRLGIATFARIAPATLTEVANVRSGINLLLDIDHDNITQNNSFSSQDVYALIAIARMITLSTIATISQANTGDESECDADQINDTQATDFRNDLDLVQGDLENAGFPSDFRLLTRATSIFDTLENAGFADETVGVRTVVADAFSSYTPPCSCATCEQAKLDAYDPEASEN